MFQKNKISIPLFFLFCFLPSMEIWSDSSLFDPSEYVSEYEVLTKGMQDLETLAVENNPLYLREKQNIGIARGNLITASLYFNPTIGLQQQFIGASQNSGVGLPELYATYSQPLDISGVIPQRKKVAIQDFQISISLFSEFDRIFRLRLRQNFLAYIYLSEVLKAQEGFLAGYRELLELTKFRAEKGDISYLEYDRIELERLEIERNSRDLLYKRNQIEKQLGILIGVTNPKQFYSKEYKLRFLSLAELGLEFSKFNIENRPDYQALQVQENRDRLNVELKRREAVPTLNLGGEYMRKGNESFAGVFASIPLPIFNRNQGEILGAEEKEKYSRMSREAKKNEIELELKILFKELKDREEQLLEYRRIRLLEKNKSVQEKTRLGYLRGAFNLVNLIEAERNYINVMKNYFELLFLYYNTLEEYKSASGIGIKNIQRDFYE